MRRVAEHLADQAMLASDKGERDVFGRSAYNRYYYSTFLLVRESLRRMQVLKEQDDIAHASIPQMFDGSIRGRLNKSRSHAEKIQDRESVKIFSDALSAARNLAFLMNEARGIRTAADYHPEVGVIFSQQGFQLMSMEIDKARNWPNKAKAFLGPIERAWRLA
jgi:hypothetical protein